MKIGRRIFVALLIFFCISCDEESTVIDRQVPESTTIIPGNAILKVFPSYNGWVSLQEFIQPQYLTTQPMRKLVWHSPEFASTHTYGPPDDWSLIDAVLHPSGQVSAALINFDIRRDPFLKIKVVRIENGVVVSELLLEPLPAAGERTKYYPASLDRVRLESYGENVFVVARWDYNEVEAFRIGYLENELRMVWQTLVEPDAYAGSIGIIGGGYDNFHQGDRYFFVYSGVDEAGNLYVAVPSHEELVLNHDLRFQDNLSAKTDPANYDWGLAILTKISASGKRKYSTLAASATKKRLINFRVGQGRVYLVGRIKKGMEPGDWDAWIMSADASTGDRLYESAVDIKQGDMFWDVLPTKDGTTVAVGTKEYVQNPAGASVSNFRLASAVILDPSGKVTGEIELPQGPQDRGSEAMFVGRAAKGMLIFAGVHNAPGTHAEVYCDGFIAIREIETNSTP